MLGTHEIGDVVVVGVPDDEWGESVVAMVTAPEAFDTDTVRATLDGVLPSAWMPRDVITLESFPALPSGKADRAALRRLAIHLTR